MITRIATVAVLLLSAVVNAFTPLPTNARRSSSIALAPAVSSRTLSAIASKHSRLILFSTAEDQSSTVPIILNGQNIELTPALDEYVNKRIGGILKKLASSGSVRECDVVLSVNKNPKVCWKTM
jgi:Sigma 54 modulation protein / S30EA ribosomal protein